MPYVYMCIHKETGEIYIGYRCKNVKLNKPSHIDLPEYKSSSKIVNPNFNDYDWFIIAEFFNATDAYDFEQSLIYERWGDPLLLNDTCHFNKSRFRKPLITTTETRQKISIAMTGKKKPKRTPEHQFKLNQSRLGKGTGPFSESHKNNMKKPKIKITCPHCGLLGGANTMKRYHFGYCKEIKDILNTKY